MKGQKKKSIVKTKHNKNGVANSNVNSNKLGNNAGITLVALIVSIIVMLILAGVSINAVVGDNGIITQAQNATYATSCAVLEEWIQQLYVENYDTLSGLETKVVGLVNLYSDYFYDPSADGVGTKKYIVDSERTYTLFNK